MRRRLGQYGHALPVVAGSGDLVHGGPALERRGLLHDLPREFVLALLRHGLQLEGAVAGERLGREGEVVGLGQGAQVEVVLGVHRRGDVDVELEHLKELALKFVPENESVVQDTGDIRSLSMFKLDQFLIYSVLYSW